MITIDTILTPSNIDLQTLRDIEILRPFGM